MAKKHPLVGVFFAMKNMRSRQIGSFPKVGMKINNMGVSKNRVPPNHQF